MEITLYENTVVRAGELLTPAILLAASALWLLLATGVAGRIALYVEELPHRAGAFRSVGEGAPRQLIDRHRSQVASSPTPTADIRPAPTSIETLRR